MVRLIVLQAHLYFFRDGFHFREPNSISGVVIARVIKIGE